MGLFWGTDSFPVFGFLKHGLEIDPETFVLNIDDLYWLDDALVLKSRLGLDCWLDMDEAMDNKDYKRPGLDDCILEMGYQEDILYSEIYKHITLDSIPFVKKNVYSNTGINVYVSIGKVEGKEYVCLPEMMKGVEYNPRYCYNLLEDTLKKVYSMNQN